MVEEGVANVVAKRIVVLETLFEVDYQFLGVVNWNGIGMRFRFFGGIGFGAGEFGRSGGRLGILEFVESGLNGVVDGLEVVLEVLPLEGEFGDGGGVGLEEVEGFADLLSV